MWMIRLLPVLCLFSGSKGLFEDQAFKFDWRQRLVGVPFKSGFLDAGSSTKLILATDANVLSVLDANTGKIKWRHQLSSDPEAQLMDFSLSASGKRCSTLTATSDEMTVQSWSPTTGLLTGEAVLLGKRPDFGYLLGNEVIAVYREKQSLKIDTFESKSGNFLRQNTFTLGTQDPSVQCFKTNTAFSCVSLELNMLYFVGLPVEQDAALSAVSLDTMGLKNPQEVTNIYPVPNRDSIAIDTPKMTLTLNFKNGKLMGSKRIKSEHERTLVLSGCEGSLVSVSQTENELKVLALNEDGQGLSDKKPVLINMEQSRGQLVSVAASCSVKRAQPFTRLMVQFEDGSISSVSDAGDLFWTREEGLSSIEDVVLVDTGDHVVFEDEEFGTEYGEALYSETDHKRDVFTQFVKRIKYHATQLHAHITHLISAKDLGFLWNQGSNHDDFGIRKVVVAVTEHRKVYGLDSKTGNVLWTLLLPDLVPSLSKLFIQRSAHHFGMDPVCSVVYKTTQGQVNVLTFNPLNGKATEPPKTVTTSYTKAFILHHANENLVRPLVLLTPSNQLVIEPQGSVHHLKAMSGKVFLATLDPNNDEKIVGYRMVAKGQEVVLQATWTFSSPGAKIISLIGKPSDQQVHSLGRVMADRSVLFKYVNPNLGFLMAEGKDASLKTFINVYLIDLVTGRVVFSATHKRVTGPYHVVHSENWAVYTYYNEKSRRAELSSLELYEGKTQHNATVFSSLHNTINPLVERQSFILGPSYVTAMKDTLTEKSITTKHVLMATSTGAIYDIPKHLLDPRRPNMNTPPDQREPGLPPYIPELQLPPESVLNYNQTVLSAKGITTAHTGLESTSVVFVHGLDLYCAHVTPSKGFDLLKDDFDYYVIASVLFALVVAAFVTRRLAQRKALNQAWR